MNVSIELTGTSSMLCHNVQLADPFNEWARKIKEISSKRKKTEDDLEMMGKLEWFGSLYLCPEIPGPVLPTANIRKCLINAAKINRLGKQVERALAFSDMFVPIAYKGPRELEKLYDSKGPVFRHRAVVTVQRNKVVRVRPKFQEWAVVADALLLEDVLDPGDLQRIIELAGLAEGLGDNRVNGYGRFTGKLEVTKNGK